MSKLGFVFAVISGIAFYSSSAFSADNLVDNATKVEFPAQVTFNANGVDYTLEGTGVATRKKFFVKVYSVAHYLQNPVAGTEADVLKEVFDDAKAKQFTLQWLRTIDAAKISGAFAESFDKTLSESEKTTFKADLDKFLGLFSHDVKSGDQSIIRWIPGGTIEVAFNDSVVGEVKNPAFAKAVWDIWFGPHSVVDKGRLIEKFVQK